VALSTVDWIIIAGYFAFNLLIGLYYRKKATGDTGEYFVSGRNVSWWLAGTSMVATTFAADTPLAVTEMVARNGIAGNWFWWSFVFSGMLTVFFYAKLWRRAGVMTDVEFAEIRYAGRPAAFLRGFRACYLGLPVNLIITGWVNLAMVTILMYTLNVGETTAVLICLGIMALTASISTLSGLWGVLVMDVFQFVLKMSMVILLAVFAVQAVGGMDGLLAGLSAVDAARNAASGTGGSILSFIPDGSAAWMPLATFLVYIAVNWWASWYPGAEPGGGGYIAQRIFAAKNEKHSMLATLWFNIAHYALRPWPWIIVALVAVVKFQADPEFIANPRIGYVRVMMLYTPVWLRGLMIAAFAAAYMSTIGTQLNWGASYLINDVYRRFIRREESERHYVRASQAVTVLLMLLSAVVSRFMDSISGAWMFLMAVGAGTGLVYILRWYWWRINAWSEVAAMTGAFVTSMLLFFVFRLDMEAPADFAVIVLVSTAVTTVIWLAATFLTKPEPQELLVAFYRRVRPSAALWKPVAAAAPDIEPQRDGMLPLASWLLGCVMIYAALFGVGHLIFRNTAAGLASLALGAACFAVIYRSYARRGWEVLSR
jgi:Na+/proline symporter